MTGPTVVVAGHASGTPAILPITSSDLLGPASEHHAYVAAGLNTLVSRVDVLAADVRAGHLDAARTAWLPAHLTYERLGAVVRFIEDNWLSGERLGNGSNDASSGSLYAPGGVLDFHVRPHLTPLILNPSTGEPVLPVTG